MTVNRRREAENLWRWYIDSIRKEEPNAEMLDGILRLSGIKEAGDERIVIRVENDFIRGWIEDRLLDSIKASFRKMAERPDLDVQLVVEPQAPVPADDAEIDEGEPRPKGTPARPRLNPKYVFDHFVVSSSNQFAHAVCLATGKAPGKQYNPLFLYGGVGLGKTHLLQAIGHRVLEKTPEASVVYVSCEEFLNEMIDALSTGKLKRFRKKYRTADVLLIDDIQFIAGKEQTQEEFFNTFNELHNSGRQIVFSSDRPPHEIQRVEKRLISRFESGMVADIAPPDYELRVAILKKQADAARFTVDDGIFAYIARKVVFNIRQLEGALIKLIGYVQVLNKKVTPELVDEVLAGYSQSVPKRLTIDGIIKSAADYYGVTPADLVGKRRQKGIVRPRQVAMALARELTGATLGEIGERFGGKDHSTVLYACEKVNGELRTDPSFKGEVDEIRARIAGA